MKAISFAFAITALVASNQSQSQSITDKNFSSCASFTGNWVGTCLRDGVGEYDILSIEQTSCADFSIDDVKFLVGVPVESVTQDESTVTTTKDLVKWHDDSKSILLIESVSKSKVVISGFTLDYEVKGSQEMFLRGSEIIQEGQYVEVANKNGEVKQFNHSVSCIYQKS
jgi:hypothetical protein